MEKGIKRKGETNIGFDKQRWVVEHGVEEVQSALKRAKVVQVTRNLLASPADKVRHELMQSRVAPNAPERGIAVLGRAAASSPERVREAGEVQLQLA